MIKGILSLLCQGTAGYTFGYSVILTTNRWSDMSFLAGQVFDSLETAFIFARNMLQVLE